MKLEELEEIWKEVKKDAKEHPESYFRPHLTFWDIRMGRRLKKLIKSVVIFNKLRIKRPKNSYLIMCENCEGNGRLINASAYSITKNDRTYCKVRKELITCLECDGKGYIK